MNVNPVRSQLTSNGVNQASKKRQSETIAYLIALEIFQRKFKWVSSRPNHGLNKYWTPEKYKFVLEISGCGV